MAVNPADVMASPNDQLALHQAMSYIVARTGATFGEVVLATKEEAVAGAEKSSQELGDHFKTCQMCINERTADGRVARYARSTPKSSPKPESSKMYKSCALRTPCGEKSIFSFAFSSSLPMFSLCLSKH